MIVKQKDTANLVIGILMLIAGITILTVAKTLPSLFLRNNNLG